MFTQKNITHKNFTQNFHSKKFSPKKFHPKKMFTQKMFTQQIFTQKNFHTKKFSHKFFFTESVRLSFVNLRWAQLYVSLVESVSAKAQRWGSQVLVSSAGLAGVWDKTGKIGLKSPDPEAKDVHLRDVDTKFLCCGSLYFERLMVLIWKIHHGIAWVHFGILNVHRQHSFFALFCVFVCVCLSL